MIAYEADFFGRVLLGIMEILNKGIYGLVGMLCQLFMNISNTTMFSDDIIEAFLGRVYVVLGIFMLFKLSISLLNSIVNPDTLFDKEKGMQKIVSRTIIALMMLIFSPTVFKTALDWQGKIALLVPRVILGQATDSNTVSLNDQGEMLASTALKAFITVNSECEEREADAEEMQKHARTVNSTIKATYERCATSGAKKKTYLFEFSGFVSIIAGGFLVFFLANYCIDIAIRVIKFGILRILAPIPIISYIDPKSEKNGAFGNWLKECGSTYVELFIKLGILYFVIFILGGIADGESSVFVYPSGLDGGARAFVLLFLILGAFFFMGKAADFICGILGVKKPDSSGGFMKGLAGVLGAAAVAGGAISSGINRYKAGELLDKTNGNQVGFTKNPAKFMANKGRNIAKAILGAGVGAATAGQAVATSKGINKFTAANKKVMQSNANNLTRAAHGASLLTDIGDNVSKYFGGSDVDVIKYQLSKEKDLMNFINDKGSKKGKATRLDFVAHSGDPNYGRVTQSLLNGTGGSLVGGETLSDFIRKKNEALNAYQAGTGNGKFEWGGLTDIDVNDANLDYFQSELTTLSGVEFMKDKMLRGDQTDKDEIMSALKAAGKTSMDNVVISDMKKSITEKENALRSLKS